jgi:CBS domain-containing protein
MTRPVITIGKGEPVTDAVALMQEHHINSVVAMDGANLAGRKQLCLLRFQRLLGS